MQHNVQESQIIPGPSFYPNLHPKLIGSILSQDDSHCHGNPFSSFCVILPTNQPTNQQMDTDENITPLAEVIKR